MATSLAFTRYPALGGARPESTSPKRGGSAARTLRSPAFQLHGLRCDLKFRGVRVEAWGAHCLRFVGPLLAPSRVITANAAGAGDGKWAAVRRSRQRAWQYGADDGRGKRGGYGAIGGQLQLMLRTRGIVPLVFAVRGRPRFGADGGVGAEDGRGARGGNEGGVGDGERTLHLLRAPAILRVVLPVPDRSWLRAEDSEALDTIGAGGEVITAALAMGSGYRRCYARGGACGSGRVVLAADAFGARGGNKKRRRRWERPSRALRTQEVVKVVPGVRQAQASGGDGSTLTLTKSHGVREGDEATWAARNASIAWRGSGLGSRRRGVEREGRWFPRAASGAPGRCARRMLRSNEAGIDSVEKASGASEEA
ncbi:hypothetical protein B0H14DRAFT_3133466 [Mycena olivaceomarginata]|nr:hypothetical protein B0H14DRAFT_3133466 [Mycena olivaceomarginata]